MEIPPNFYRASAKALVRDAEGRTLLLREKDGTWDLPGGGVEYGEDPRETVRREVAEECGVEAVAVAEAPKTLWTVAKANRAGETYWSIFVAYETTVASHDFVPSPEAHEFAFFASSDAESIPLAWNLIGRPEIFGR